MITLTGCSGFNAIPDVATPIAEPLSHPAAFKGTVMGGHAPVVGSELFVFQAGTTGYASTPQNALVSGQVGSDSLYGPYITTGPSGSFSITGDYTCNLNHPVYVASLGGTASTTATLVTFSGASAATSGSTTTVTFASTSAPAVGTVISFGSRIFTTTYSTGYTALNGTTQTVTASSPTSFSIVPTVAVTGSSTGGGFGIVGGVDNPAIVNIAVLGNCPGTGHQFADNLTFVYLDEVSTVAAAYALQAFGTGFYAIGAPTSNLLGIENAAINAGQLYNVNNNYQSGGVALTTTSYVGNGNGIVPQATVDTLGNILAACVDSTNTASVTSAQCSTLFNTATSNGDTTGTKPTDISSAAFNIAKYPAGAGTQHGTFPATLYTLQGSSFTPFNPALSAAPNDFGIAISYDTTLNTHVTQAESVAFDGFNNLWTTAQGDHSINFWSPVGKLVTTHSDGYNYGYVSIDASSNAWTGSVNSNKGIEKFGPSGLLSSTTGTFQSAYTVIANASTVTNTNADIYTFNGTNGQTGYWLVPGTPETVVGPYIVNNNFVSHGAIDSTGDLYLTSESGNQITRTLPTNGILFILAAGFFNQSGFPLAGPTVTGAAHQPQPEVPAVDSANNAWVPIQSTYSQLGLGSPIPGLYEVSSTGTVTSFYSGTGTNSAGKVYTGANFYQSFGSAIDGLGNVWISNRYNSSLGGSSSAPGNSSIIELNSAGTAISPSTNYTYGGLLNDPLNLAIDISGDVWVTNYTGNKLVEIIGAAAPVSAPLASAAAAGKLGTRP